MASEPFALTGVDTGAAEPCVPGLIPPAPPDTPATCAGRAIPFFFRSRSGGNTPVLQISAATRTFTSVLMTRRYDSKAFAFGPTVLTSCLLAAALAIREIMATIPTVDGDSADGVGAVVLTPVLVPAGVGCAAVAGGRAEAVGALAIGGRAAVIGACGRAIVTADGAGPGGRTAFTEPDTAPPLAAMGFFGTGRTDGFAGTRGTGLGRTPFVTADPGGRIGGIPFLAAAFAGAALVLRDSTKFDKTLAATSAPSVESLVSNSAFMCPNVAGSRKRVLPSDVKTVAPPSFGGGRIDLARMAGVIGVMTSSTISGALRTAGGGGGGAGAGTAS